MKALTLHQPYATLLAIGRKRIETRGWATTYRGPIAIHAGAKAPADGFRIAADYANVTGPEFLVRLPSGIPRSRADSASLLDLNNQETHPLPLGAVVATAHLVACVPMVVEGPVTTELAATIRTTGALVLAEDGPEMAYYSPCMGHDDLSRDCTDQRPYGHYEAGRFAWILDHIVPTTVRCPACYGTGNAPDRNYGMSCRACKGEQRCEPIPAIGKQRIWEWNP